MRKETIVKFEKEFIAWCKGESVLKGAPISMNNRELYWETVKEFKDWYPLDTTYIINDEYVEFRKALAEGKTVQWSSSDNQYNHPIWETVTNIDIYFPVSRYRIKPEEPQFKVGDWVRNSSSNSIFKYTSDMLKPDQSCCELWKPQPREWCWFYNFNGLLLTIGKFIQMTNDKYLADAPNDKWTLSTQVFKHCEPFMGELPTHLQQLE